MWSFIHTHTHTHASHDIQHPQHRETSHLRRFVSLPCAFCKHSLSLFLPSPAPLFISVRSFFLSFVLSFFLVLYLPFLWPWLHAVGRSRRGAEAVYLWMRAWGHWSLCSILSTCPLSLFLTFLSHPSLFPLSLSLTCLSHPSLFPLISLSFSQFSTFPSFLITPLLSVFLAFSTFVIFALVSPLFTVLSLSLSLSLSLLMDLRAMFKSLLETRIVGGQKVLLTDRQLGLGKQWCAGWELVTINYSCKGLYWAGGVGWFVFIRVWWLFLNVKK